MLSLISPSNISDSKYRFKELFAKSNSDGEHTKQAAKQKVTVFTPYFKKLFLSPLLFSSAPWLEAVQRALQRQQPSSERKPKNGFDMRKDKRRVFFLCIFLELAVKWAGDQPISWCGQKRCRNVRNLWTASKWTTVTSLKFTGSNIRKELEDWNCLCNLAASV